MKLPLLPEVVRITPDECHEWSVVEKDGVKVREKGEKKPDAPVFLFRPVTGIEQATALGQGENQVAMYAQVALNHLTGAEDLEIGGEPFDIAKKAHVAALDGLWLMECGQVLMTRAHLTEQDQGK